MDMDDWQVHATHAWTISGVLAKELRKERGQKINGDGRSLRKTTGTIDDVLAMIPETGVILRKELYKKLQGLVARDNTREFVVQLLREERIFIHKIPNDNSKPLTAYSQERPAFLSLSEAK
jgi:hypothetical protein